MQLDDITIEQLDSGLQEGEDIKQVYKELSQTFSKDHLSFEKVVALVFFSIFRSFTFTFHSPMTLVWNYE